MFEIVTEMYPKYLEDKEQKEFMYIHEPVMPRDGTALATELATARS